MSDQNSPSILVLEDDSEHILSISHALESAGISPDTFKVVKTIGEAIRLIIGEGGIDEKKDPDILPFSAAILDGRLEKLEDDPNGQIAQQLWDEYFAENRNILVSHGELFLYLLHQVFGEGLMASFFLNSSSVRDNNNMEAAARSLGSGVQTFRAPMKTHERSTDQYVDKSCEATVREMLASLS